MDRKVIAIHHFLASIASLSFMKHLPDKSGSSEKGMLHSDQWGLNNFTCSCAHYFIAFFLVFYLNVNLDILIFLFAIFLCLHFYF